MKRLIVVFGLLIALSLTGCGQYIAIGFSGTSSVFHRGDGVIVTCPVSVGKVILKKY